MGGQACVFYGAAEFSRDCDIVIVADQENLTRLDAALEELQAVSIAVPPMDRFISNVDMRSISVANIPMRRGIRLDVMTKMRGCDGFDALWERRTTIQGAGWHDL